MKAKFNLNDEVTVTLTAKGSEIMNKWPFKESKIFYEEGQTYTTEMWHLFEIFGRYLFNGCDIPFEDNIITINNDQPMNTYNIKVDYHTGDSFSDYDTNEYIEISWTDIDIVNENIRRMKEQLEFYNKEHSYSTTMEEMENLRKEALTKPWCVTHNDIWNRERGENDFPEYCSINLLNDKKETFRISVPWIGYFESNQIFNIITNTIK